MKKLPVSKINDFLKACASKEKVYLPVDNKDASKGASYQQWKDGVTLSNALNTVRSAKDFFFPQTENLFDMKMDGKKIEIIDTRKETEDFIIFGVRACDVRSFTVLDKVFLDEPVDTYYKNRREHSTIISLSCTKPAHTCFCGQLNIDAANPEGDIRSWKTDSSFYFESVTEKGKKLLESLSSSGLLSEAGTDGEKEVESQKKATEEAVAKLPVTFPHDDTFAEKNLNKLFESPVWGKLSETCLACGTCTFVCPTCQCYDIREFDTGHGVKRFRCWDSCMYSDFTKMSAGQPRPTQLERFRQRFMHKLVYYPANNNGLFGCVGCGRCLAKCPISMNIIKVSQALSADAKKGEN